MQPEKLGPYRIAKTLGRGGMGTVYEGLVDETINEKTGKESSEKLRDKDQSRVAIKVLSPHLATAEGFRDRFEAEIESLKKLRHENIVRLYGYGQQDGFLFYSMELVDGPSLEEEIANGRRFDWREVTQIGIMICKALKHAHDCGVIHRDLKPANLLVAPDETIKLTDFGIARLFGGIQLTQAGGLLGTAEFMAPEQADGSAVTDRCDQYSLGGLLYTLLASRPPFRARNMPEMLQLQRFANPEPVSRYAPDTPKELERIVMKLLAKDPQERYANTSIVSRELDTMLRSLSKPVDRGFEVTPQQETPPDSPPISQAETMAVTSIKDVSESDAGDVPKTEMFHLTSAGSLSGPEEKRITPAAATPVGNRTNSDSGVEATSIGGGEKSPPPQGSRFITLEEESRLAEQQQETNSSLAPAIGLAVVLLAIAGLVFWFMQPPTADKLYQSIATAAESGDSRALSSAESEIREFLDRFPKDDRAEQARDYLEEVEIVRLDRQLSSRARNASAEGSLLIEQMVHEANQIAKWDEQAAARRFQSIVDLYSNESTSERSAAEKTRTRRCLELARRHLDQLQEHTEKGAQQQSKDLTDRLNLAQSLLETDPAQASKMLQAIVDLFSEKPWATEQVDRARSLLSKSDLAEPKNSK